MKRNKFKILIASYNNEHWVEYNLASVLNQTYDNYEVIHFRMLNDTNFLPYGRSLMEPGRRVYKQLMMMEDAMLIHRIMRAPEKRVFYMNVGGITPNVVDTYMGRTVKKM